MSKKRIIVISTIIGRQKVYVSRHVTSCENGSKSIVSYTRVAEEAKEFASKGLAADFIPLIKNPYDRVFQWDIAEVDSIKQKELLKNAAAEEALQ